MKKKCLIVSNSVHQYKLSFQDLTKIIFREKKIIPKVPLF